MNQVYTIKVYRQAYNTKIDENYNWEETEFFYNLSEAEQHADCYAQPAHDYELSWDYTPIIKGDIVYIDGTEWQVGCIFKDSDGYIMYNLKSGNEYYTASRDEFTREVPPPTGAGLNALQANQNETSLDFFNAEPIEEDEEDDYLSPEGQAKLNALYKELKETLEAQWIEPNDDGKLVPIQERYWDGYKAVFLELGDAEGFEINNDNGKYWGQFRPVCTVTAPAIVSHYKDGKTWREALITKALRDEIYKAMEVEIID